MYRHKNINLIVACQRSDWSISSQGRIPWHAPKDMAFFKQKTRETRNRHLQNAVVMGRKTFETIGNKPLPKRINYVVTRQKQLTQNSTLYYPSLEDALKTASQNPMVENVWVIGGQDIYLQTLNNYSRYLDRAFVTLLDTTFPGDQYFHKSLLESKFYLAHKRKDVEDNGIPLEFREYRSVNAGENQYLDLVDRIMAEGLERADRTGTGTFGLFGLQMVFDISEYFPLLTTKQMSWKIVVKELLWFLSGSTDNEILREQGVRIWNGNSTREYLDSVGLVDLPENDIGAGYGFQWRHFGADYQNCKTDYTGQGVDQVTELIKGLKENPTGRRHILSAWNPAALSQQALPPCHILAQFYVREGKYLDCQLYQRSGDMGLGVPFNIASYAFLVYMIAKVTNLHPGRFYHVLGDAHIYSNHIDALRDQIERVPYKFPRLILANRENIFEFKVEDFQIVDYIHHPAIKMDMAV